jgi:hypothetical protein
MMEDTKMASQHPPPPATEVKAGESADSKESEAVSVTEGNATTPAPAPEAEPTPTPAPATGVTKQILEVMEGILHRLTAYRTEEYVFDTHNPRCSS